jgi:hypothetical protein
LGPLFIIFVTATCIEAASTIRFTAAGHTVPEWAGTVSLTVQRLGDINGPVAVDNATVDGTAAAGAKYTAASGTLIFAAEQTNKTVVVQISNNGLVEGTKKFEVILSNPTGGAVLADPTQPL